MRFREKFRDFKNRLTDRHMYSVIVGLIVFMTAIAAYQAKVSADYKTKLVAQYSRAFDDLTEDVSEIETSLAKGIVVTEPKTVVRLANDIYAKASAASASLGQLPLSDVAIDNTAKFLSQVGDFTYMLSLRYMDDPTITAEERNTMMDLSRYANTLGQSLLEMQSDLYNGDMQFSSAPKQGSVAMASGMEKVEERFRDYPSLIYDGPFSDHVQTKESPLLKDAAEISVEEAQARIPELVAQERYGEVTYNGECGGRLPTYMFTIKPDSAHTERSITLQITKKGGMLLQMLDNRQVSESKIDIDEAKKRAAVYLEKLQILSMRDSYFEVKNNIATINFAFTDKDVICYPDLVKLRVAMDTGEILGMEGSGYIMNHTPREYLAPKLDAEFLRTRISPLAEIESTHLTVIPLETQTEALCWEYKCHVDDKNFLLYLNAETGHEENVLMLLQTDGGMLTI